MALQDNYSRSQYTMQKVILPKAEISYIDHATAANSDLLPVLLLHGFASSVRDNWLETNWVSFLNEKGFRVIALDNRGHGHSQKFYDRDDYTLEAMVGDAVDLMDYLQISKFNLLGYSMGARIASLMTMSHAERIKRVVLGGNGYGMIEGNGDWTPVRDGLLAASMDDVSDLRARAFRRFAERTGSDKKALAACVLGLRQIFQEVDFQKIAHQVLIAIGSDDDIAGSGQKLADLMPNARYFEIAGRDHMRASTDKSFMHAVAEFLQ